MAQTNLSTTVTVPKDDSGPDLGGLVAFLVLLLIAICSFGAWYLNRRIRRWHDNRRKYKEYFNNNARFRDDDPPDDRYYRQNDRRGDPRQTRSHRDQDGNHFHFHGFIPPSAHDGNAPHAQEKGHASHKNTQTSTQYPDHGREDHATNVHKDSEEHRKSVHETQDFHSVKSNGTSSSSRVVHTHTTQPVPVDSYNSWHFPHFDTHMYPIPVSNSRASSYTATTHPQPTNWGQLVPVSTLRPLPHSHFPSLPHVTPAPHPYGWHAGIHRTHSKIGTEDPDDSP